MLFVTGVENVYSVPFVEQSGFRGDAAIVTSCWLPRNCRLLASRLRALNFATQLARVILITVVKHAGSHCLEGPRRSRKSVVSVGVEIGRSRSTIEAFD